MMSSRLGVIRINFFIVDRESLEMHYAIEICSLLPKLVLMKFHGEVV